MKKLLVAALILCTTIISGCGNEIDDIAYVVAVGVDLSDDAEYAFTFAIGNPGSISSGEEGGGDENVLVVETATGNSLFTAGEKIERLTGQKINFSHAELMVVSQDLAQYGITPLLDSIMRNLNQRPKLVPAVSLSSAQEVVKSIRSKFEGNPEKYLKKIFEDKGKGAYFNSREVLGRMKSPDGGIGIPLVAVDDGGISVSSVAIFQNGYMKSTLEDLMCYKLLCGKGGNFSYDADPEGTLFLNQRAKPVVKIFADEKLTIDIYVAIDSSIAVLKADNKEALRYVAAEQIRKRLIDTLVESRDKGSDVFGFFKYGKSSFLTEEAWNAYNWRERYKTAQFNVTVEILPEKTGLLKGAA